MSPKPGLTADRHAAFGFGYGYTVNHQAIAVETPNGNAVVLVMVPPSWASPDPLEEFGARPTASVSGFYPICGVVGAPRTSDEAFHVTFDHESDCPASDDLLIARLDAERPKPSKAPGRNAPCPCGSGRKFKACCGAAT